MYVDDLTQSVLNKHDAHKIMVDLPITLQSGGFEMTKFAINNKELLREIPVEHRAKEVHTFSPDSICRALGVKWVIQDDMFCFSVPKTALGKVTRRSMLSFVASIFDPLGFITPWVLAGKLLLQQATRLKLNWDDYVSEDIQREWDAWLVSLTPFTLGSFFDLVRL